MRKNYLDQAKIVCEQLKANKDDAFPYYTLIKVHTMKIKDELQSEDPSDEQIHALVRSAEKVLQEGVTRHPDNPYLRSAEAALANVLSEYDRALKAMERSFELNPRGSLIALRLASHYLKGRDVEKAVETLRKALAAKSSDMRLHAMYAKTLMENNRGTDDEIIYHLRKGIVPSDNNLESRLLLGRQLFLNGKLEESNDVFNELRRRHMSPEVRNQLRFGTNEIQRGTVSSVEATDCMLIRDGDSAAIYCNRSDVSGGTWNLLSKGCRVRFRLAFCMNGARAHKVEKE
jgi:tetratricopeptide (TPR) repeat protein